MTLDDFSTDQSCSEQYTFTSMGPPNYVDYIGEDPWLTGNGYSGPAPLTPFSSTLFWAVVSPSNGATLDATYPTTGQTPVILGNININVPISYSSQSGCYDSECFGLDFTN